MIIDGDRLVFLTKWNRVMTPKMNWRAKRMDEVSE